MTLYVYTFPPIVVELHEDLPGKIDIIYLYIFTQRTSSEDAIFFFFFYMPLSKIHLRSASELGFASVCCCFFMHSLRTLLVSSMSVFPMLSLSLSQRKTFGVYWVRTRYLLNTRHKPGKRICICGEGVRGAFVSVPGRRKKKQTFFINSLPPPPLHLRLCTSARKERVFFCF